MFIFSPYSVLARELLPVLGLGGADNKPVLDPFCGAGTVLVESAALGKASIGVDVSPLACFVSQHHVWTPEDPADAWGRLTAHAEVTYTLECAPSCVYDAFHLGLAIPQ
jgi:23S rRNA G2445 N2-methylase RlmL